LKLARLFGDEKYERFAVTTLRLSTAQMKRYPQGFGRTLSALEFYLGPTKEIVSVGERNNDLERELRDRYLPDALLIPAADPTKDSSQLPLLENRETIDGKPTVYVCENFVCQRPVTSVEELRELLKH